MRRIKFLLSVVLVVAMAAPSFAQVKLGWSGLGGWTYPLDNPTYVMASCEIYQAPADFDASTALVSDVFDLVDGTTFVSQVMDKDGMFILDDKTGDAGKVSKFATEDNADMTVEFVLLYDADNLYVVAKVTDDDYTADDAFEVMWAPYADSIKRADWPVLDGESVDDGEWQQIYGYWSEAGSYKTQWIGSGAGSEEFSDIQCSDYSGVYSGGNPVNNADGATLLGLEGTLYDADDGSPVEYILTIPFATAMGDLSPEDGTTIAFNINYVDKDAADASSTDPDPDGFYHQAAWSTDQNDVWITMYYCGHATFSAAQVSVDEINSELGVSVYPNPVANELHVKGFDKLQSASVSNIVGQNVKNFDVVTESLDISDLTQGVYFVQFTTKDGQTLPAQKIVKQ